MFTHKIKKGILKFFGKIFGLNHVSICLKQTICIKKPVITIPVKKRRYIAIKLFKKNLEFKTLIFILIFHSFFLITQG